MHLLFILTNVYHTNIAVLFQLEFFLMFLTRNQKKKEEKKIASMTTFMASNQERAKITVKCTHVTSHSAMSVGSQHRDDVTGVQVKYPS